MTVKLLLEFAVVIAAILMGSRYGGVGLGLWGGAGVLVLSYGFGLPPTAPPIDVMLIILAVIMATSVMEAAGGIDWLVRVAEGLIRRNPKQITIVAPVVSWLFTLGAGTGHVFYPLLPVIHEVAHENGIRPERPIAVSTIASQQAITASPVSAATAAMIALFEPAGIKLGTIIAIAIPATLIGVIVAALVQTRVGKELKDDPEYQRRLKAGEIEPPRGGKGTTEQKELPKTARTSALMFLLGVGARRRRRAVPGPAAGVPQGGEVGPPRHGDHHPDRDALDGGPHPGGDAGPGRERPQDPLLRRRGSRRSSGSSGWRGSGTPSSRRTRSSSSARSATSRRRTRSSSPWGSSSPRSSSSARRRPRGRSCRWGSAWAFPPRRSSPRGRP